LQEDPIGFEALRPAHISPLLPSGFPKNDKLLQGLAFTSVAELNIYRYLSNNPLNFVDPYGQFGSAFYANAKKHVAKFVVATKTALKIALENELKAVKVNPFDPIQRCIEGAASGSKPAKGLVGGLCQFVGMLFRGGAE